MKQFARLMVLRVLILFACLYWLEVQKRPTLIGALPAAPRAPLKPAPAKPGLHPQAAASLLTFDDDEDGYRAWIAAHESGYVINTPKAHGSTADILHRASCATISSPRIENYTTGDFKKIVAPDKAPLVAWLGENSEDWRPCGRCKP